MHVLALQQTVKKVLYFLCVAGGLSMAPSACSQSAPKEERRSLDSPENKKNMTINHNNNPFSIVKTEAEWRQQLGQEAYRVLREKGTERPFTSPFETEWDAGIYVCKGCGTELFESKTKFDAGCGWPSFYQAVDKSAVKEIVDKTHGMTRTEVVCAACGGHLGHVFNDGYGQPTGLRYCINGVSLGFKKKED
jgi:peptide-methionine (R)-S-oxide reductase